MNRSYKVNGLILSRRSIGEADRLLTVFTREYGKKTILAKGIRRARSRRAAHLELFTHAQLVLHKGRTFDLVTEVATKEAFSHLREKLERIGFACIGVELTERLTAENQESEAIFNALLQLIRILNATKTARTDAQAQLKQFKQFLLFELGFIAEVNIQEEKILDAHIERILERQLKSPDLLTNIQHLL
jgi:DNA repair protein RecO (recombination protein O)